MANITNERVIRFLSAAVLSFLPLSAEAMTVEELEAAIEGAACGDVIQAEPGTYVGADIRNVNCPGNPVVVQGPALFDNWYLRFNTGITFDGQEWQRIGTPLWITALSVYDSSEITVKNCHVHGDLNGDGSEDPYGIYFGTSSDVAVENCRFEALLKGVNFVGVDGFAVRDSDFTDIHEDGIVLPNRSNGLIESNTFSEWNIVSPSAHADAIQAWGSVSDISVVGNTVDFSSGDTAQGVFLRGTNTRLLVAGNSYVGANGNGIRVEGTFSAVYENDVQWRPQQDGFPPNLFVLNGSDNYVVNNVACSMIIDTPNSIIENNIETK